LISVIFSSSCLNVRFSFRPTIQTNSFGAVDPPESVIEQGLSHFVQPLFNVLPTRDRPGQQSEELRAVVVLPEVAEFVGDDVVDTLARRTH